MKKINDYGLGRRIEAEDTVEFMINNYCYTFRD
jgi:hypothetical protein